MPTSTYFKSFKLEGLDFLKIDVEGYEENVFEGAMETIKEYKPIIVFETYYYILS